MNTALEVLRIAERRLADPGQHYDFDDTMFCTCGHIYAATGKRGRGAFAGANASDPYAEALRAVIEANPSIAPEAVDRRNDKHYGIAWIVSDMTLDDARRAKGGDEPIADEELRATGLLHVRNAIAMLEAQYEQNRLDVLNQTQMIVNSVDVRESVTA